MSLFSIKGKGIVRDVEVIDDKRVVVLPNDWDGEVKYVRIYKLKKIK